MRNKQLLDTWRYLNGNLKSNFLRLSPGEGTSHGYSSHSKTMHLTVQIWQPLRKISLQSDAQTEYTRVSQGLSFSSGFVARKTSPSSQQRQCWAFCLLQQIVMLKVDFPHSSTWRANIGPDCSLRMTWLAACPTSVSPRIDKLCTIHQDASNNNYINDIYRHLFQTNIIKVIVWHVWKCNTSVFFKCRGPCSVSLPIKGPPGLRKIEDPCFKLYCLFRLFYTGIV